MFVVPNMPLILSLPLILALASILVGFVAVQRAQHLRARRRLHPAPLEQLAIVQDTYFQSNPVLNTRDKYVFDVIDAVVDMTDTSHRLLVQVGLEAVVRPVQTEGNSSRLNRLLRTKRVDFLVVTEDGHPVVGLQLDRGEADHIADIRNMIVHHAFKSAGIPHISIGARADLEDVAATLLKALQPDAPMPLALVSATSTQPSARM